MNTFDPHRYPGLTDNGFNSPSSHPVNRAEVETAIAYLKLLTPSHKHWRSSYGLKHEAEKWGEENGMESYVSNGALIYAAMTLGLPIEPSIDKTSPNCSIGVMPVKRQRNTPTTRG